MSKIQTVTDDPLTVCYGQDRIAIDLGAEKVLAAERNEQKVAVEIKSFLGESELFDYHAALGQLLNYRLVLEKTDPNRQLYLAAPKQTYNSLFRRDIAKASVELYQVKLIVYDPAEETIVQWQT